MYHTLARFIVTRFFLLLLEIYSNYVIKSLIFFCTVRRIVKLEATPTKRYLELFALLLCLFRLWPWKCNVLYVSYDFYDLSSHCIYCVCTASSIYCVLCSQRKNNEEWKSSLKILWVNFANVWMSVVLSMFRCVCLELQGFLSCVMRCMSTCGT